MCCFLLTGQINFDDINQDKDYNLWRSYAQSKLANVLFTRELANRLQGAAFVLYLTACYIFLPVITHYMRF